MTSNFFKKIKVRGLKLAKGFTLIETMIAILLLSTAIAGPLTIASKGLSTSLIAKDQVGAYNLAQDGMEYIRFVRDTNKLNGGNWLTGAGGTGSNAVDLTPCESGSGCYVDSIQSTVGAISSCPTTNCVINFDSNNHYYSYTTGTASQQRYIRTIKITTPVGTNNSEASVVVTVQWSASGGATHSVTLRENILDWE